MNENLDSCFKGNHVTTDLFLNLYGEESVYLASTSTVLFIVDRSQAGPELKWGRNLESGFNTEAIEGCCLLS